IALASLERERDVIERRCARTRGRVGEREILNLHAMPRRRRDRGRASAYDLAGAYGIGARVIGPLTCKRLKMRSEGGYDTACLRGILPYHVEAAEHDRSLRAAVRGATAGQPSEQSDQPATQGLARDVDRAPLRLIEEDGTAKRREACLQATLQKLSDGTCLTQCE